MWQHSVSRWLAFPLLTVAVLFGCPAAAAGPTVGEVLSVCERAAAGGNRGVDAAACEWYTAPCDCKVRTPATEGLHWCVPESEPIEATVTKVIDGLRLHTDQGSPAAIAIAQAMARL